MEQNHYGSGDNVGGNKVLNLSVPKILILGIITILSFSVFIYWKSIQERFFFNPKNIGLDISIIDSLQIRNFDDDDFTIYNDLVYHDFAIVNDTVKVIPTSEYLSKIQHNQTLTTGPKGRTSDFYNLYSEIPKINFKITNNSNKTIFFSKIILQVQSSEIDNTPIPTFISSECYNDFYDINNSTLPFEIYNEGWSPMKNVVLKFNIQPQNVIIDYNNTPYQLEYKSIEQKAIIDIYPFLKEQNVDIERLMIATNKGVIDTLLIHDGLGSYSLPYYNINNGDPEVNAIISGWITFDDIKGKHYKNKISFPISVYRLFECGEPEPETMTYNISLCEKGTNYEIAYPISQSIKPNEVDNFSIRLACSKSSRHIMKAKLYYNQDDFIEKNFDYSIILPRRQVEDGFILFNGTGKCANQKTY